MGTRKKGAEFIKHITEIIKSSTGFEKHLEKEVYKQGAAVGKLFTIVKQEEDYCKIKMDSKSADVKITSGGEGKCTAEFTVSSEHLNRMGGLHGGFTATLLDMVTTYALMSKPCHPGVSVSISVDYLKAAKEGDDVLIDANLLKAGKKLAFLECILIHKKDNSIIAKGSHTKYVDF